MIVIVCGSRDVQPTVRNTVVEVLNSLEKPFDMYSGGAKGIDTMAVDWAKQNNIVYKEYYPDWKNKGKAAGYYRNAEMMSDAISKCGVENVSVLAFWNGRSSGTKHMIELAEKYSTKLSIVNI